MLRDLEIHDFKAFDRETTRLCTLPSCPARATQNAENLRGQGKTLAPQRLQKFMARKGIRMIEDIEKLSYAGRPFTPDWAQARKDVTRTAELMADAFEIQPHDRRAFIERMVERQLDQLGEMMIDLYHPTTGTMNCPRVAD